MLIYLLSISLSRKRFEEESELIKKITLKDENSLSVLYDLYSGLLYSLIFKIVKNREDAEEVLQSIFLQVWEKAESFDMEKGSVYTWLVTLARNKSIDKVRSKDYKNNSQLSGLSGITDFELEIKYNLVQNPETNNIIDQKEKTDLILKALNELSEDQKMVIELAYYDGLSQTEISKKLNIPLGTVKTRTRQALNKLENLLTDML